MKRLSVTRTRQNIASALVRLGFAESTTEFRKSSKKGGGGKNKSKGDSSSESESSDDEDTYTVQESREEIRAKEKVPDLYNTTQLIISEKEINKCKSVPLVVLIIKF